MVVFAAAAYNGFLQRVVDNTLEINKVVSQQQPTYRARRPMRKASIPPPLLLTGRSFSGNRNSNGQRKNLIRLSLHHHE